jgi:hypothetical protein
VNGRTLGRVEISIFGRMEGCSVGRLEGFPLLSATGVLLGDKEYTELLGKLDDNSLGELESRDTPRGF